MKAHKLKKKKYFNDKNKVKQKKKERKVIEALNYQQSVTHNNIYIYLWINVIIAFPPRII